MFWRGDIKKMVDDMKIIRPHYVPMVPRIMNKIYDGVNEKLAGSKLKHAVFTYCYNKKKKLLQRFVSWPVLLLSGRALHKCNADVKNKCARCN